MKLDFKQTCAGLPEQYDVFCEGKQVAYIRLRWGYLSCEVPDVNGEIIYDHSFNAEWKGEFDTQLEREKYLDIIKCKVEEHYEDV